MTKNRYFFEQVGMKKYLGSPTVCQIALYQSLASITNVIITWPLFLALKLFNEEKWEFHTAPFLLMSGSGALGGCKTFCTVQTLTF